MSDYERRVTVERLELRAGDGERPRLIGFASVYNSKSLDLGGFVEIVRPGAFKRTLAAGADVRALVNHDPSLIIGRTKAGSLILTDDDRGLRVEITPPDTQTGRDIVENVRNGNIDGMSFGFITRKDAWDVGVTPALRELLDVELLDVSPVTYPAYPKTDIALRALEQARSTTPGVVQEALSGADIDRRRRLRLAELG
jgi:HK97 family phage prohead protease